jgi:hypothetical protein
MVFEYAHKLVRLFLRRLDSHPLSTTFVTVGGFTTAGVISWSVMEFLEEGSPNIDHASQKQPMSLEEARLRAMVENAQASNWKKNLDNAAEAQAQFMLPGRPMKKPDFMEEHNSEVVKDRQRRPTTKIWSG